MIEALAQKFIEVGTKGFSGLEPNFFNKLSPQNIKSFAEADQPLTKGDNGTENGNNQETSKENSETKENEPIKNKQEGMRREEEVEKELREEYPEEEGYTIESEVYLRDEDGNIVKDEVTGEKRRIDFVVIKDGEVVKSVEVTSKTADKTDQTAKEDRIRQQGGNYVYDSNGNLVEIPKDVKTEIYRRD